MTRYRWKTRTRRGRWLPTRDEARKAAVKAGVASWDDFGQFYKDVFTEIEERPD